MSHFFFGTTIFYFIYYLFLKEIVIDDTLTALPSIKTLGVYVDLSPRVDSDVSFPLSYPFVFVS